MTETYPAKLACELRTSIFCALVILGMNSILTKLIPNLEHASIKSILLKGLTIPKTVELFFIRPSSSLLRAWLVIIRSEFFKHSSLLRLCKPIFSNTLSLVFMPFPILSSNHNSTPRSNNVFKVSL